MNRDNIFYLIIGLGAIFLLVTVFAIVNDKYEAGPYAAEISGRMADRLQISFGSNQAELIIPDLPRKIDKATNVRVFTTSFVGKGKIPRRIEFLGNNNTVIHSVTLPLTPCIISTALIFLVLTIFAVMLKILPEEMLFRDYSSKDGKTKVHTLEDVDRHDRFTLLASLFAIFFFFSGFCGLLYQTVWLRLAYSHFGVITPVVSVVVSTFMLGLGFGSWLSGRFVTKVTEGKLHSITLYGIVEGIIGCGAFIVPVAFEQGSRLLLNAGQTNSASFLAGSGLCIAASLLPFSIAMGATYPVALRAYEQSGLRDHHRFGVLYAFNTAGAVAGCLITVFALIELLGFLNTLRIGAVLNWTIAVSSVIFGISQKKRALPPQHQYEGKTTQEYTGTPERSGSPEPQAVSEISESSKKQVSPEIHPAKSIPRDLLILFTTGFCSMAAEVAWIRAYGPVLEQAVYSFGFLLISYLTGHALGAWTYHLTVNRFRVFIKNALLIAAALSSCIAVVVANIGWMYLVVSDIIYLRPYIAIAIGAFAAVLGWLTPLLVDRYSKSNPQAAGNAYALNIAGCVAGPLVSGYLLVPLLGAQHSLILLCLPLIALLFIDRHMIKYKISAVCLSALILIPALYHPSWEEQIYLDPAIGKKKIFRDYAATTVLISAENGWKELIVNGQKMTTISPITKLMADLPLVLHKAPATDVLVICLGMGTTYKAALKWGVNVTAVELVPGVTEAFVHNNREFSSPRGRIVIDDGRRFLRRTREKFDIIIIDPPPPAEQPTSSLLSSTEFYSLLKEHLKPGGIVQAWYGHLHGEPAIGRAFARSLKESFNYIKVYNAVDDPFHFMWGLHFICSDDPIQDVTAEEFLQKLPADARQDLKDMVLYQLPDNEVEAMISQFMSRQLPLDRMPLNNPSEKITDDRPFNEYYMIRRYLEKNTKRS